MNKPEVAKLLLLASGFDRRVVDDLTTSAWFAVPEIQQARYEDAQAAVIAHQTGPNREKYLTVGHVIDGIRAAHPRPALHGRLNELFCARHYGMPARGCERCKEEQEKRWS